MKEVVLFALLGLGTGRADRRDRARRRPHVPRLGDHQPRDRRGRDGRRLLVLVAARSTSSASRSATAPALVVTLLVCALVGVLMRGARLPAAADGGAARQARRLARDPADAAVDDAALLRDDAEDDPTTSSRAAASRSSTSPIPANRFWLAGIVVVITVVLMRAVPLDPIRARDAGGVGERGRTACSPACRRTSSRW